LIVGPATVGEPAGCALRQHAVAIDVRPDSILQDKPCFAAGPVSAQKARELNSEPKTRYTIIILTQNAKRTASVPDYTALTNAGGLIETAKAGRFTAMSRSKHAENRITGRSG